MSAPPIRGNAASAFLACGLLGKPYLIDAQVARVGVAWADKPWIPPISIARERARKV